MPNLLAQIQQQLSERMRELDGVLAEYESLEQAMRALESAGARSTGVRRRSSARRANGRRAAASSGRASGNGAVSRAAGSRAKRGAQVSRASRPAKRAASAPAPRGRRGAGKRAPRGANREAILDALRRRGRGTVASELAKLSGVGRVSSYQVLTRLEKEGAVRRVEQPTGPALYTLA